jgi:antitoxin (DNA-binding transcriptional repressor) of toxin-antitoxin stability system
MTYSLREAEAHIVEILRRVKEGERFVLAEEGREMAEIRPLPGSQDEGLQGLQERGILGPLVRPEGTLSPIAEKPGALARFLESRG